MGVGRGPEGAKVPLILTMLAKKVILLISSGKKQISPLLAPPGKILKKSPSGLP